MTPVPIKSDSIVSRFGGKASSQQLESLFEALETYQRPELPDDGEHFFDWVLIRRRGIELGFVDSNYFSATTPISWGHGELLLTQAYFYSGFNDIEPYKGDLPFGLKFSDDRAAARAKLAAFEATRHSYLNDTWDVDGYRLSVTYAEAGQSIDRMACHVPEAPILKRIDVVYPDLDAIAAAFGDTAREPEFLSLWRPELGKDELHAAREDGEIDLTQTYGATLNFAASRGGPIFQSITLHRNRDMESVGWAGELPQGLDFEDSPEVLFQKVPDQPVQQSDSALTGHAVWHFDDYTLHVLYSNFDNRLLRVKMIAPGTWKCIDEFAD